jgi:hypothetical protein
VRFALVQYFVREAKSSVKRSRVVRSWIATGATAWEATSEIVGGEGDPGDSDGCENKGFAGKGIRKSMKTKGGQIAWSRETGREWRFEGGVLTKLQLGQEKRVCMSLILKG